MDLKPTYKKIKGEWVKQTAYERQNGEWMLISEALTNKVWKIAMNGDSNYIAKVFFSNNMWLALFKNGDVYASNDGMSWVYKSTCSIAISNPICENGLLIGTKGNDVYCCNLNTWAWNKTTVKESSSTLNGCVYGGGRFFISVYNGIVPPFYSDDGINWTQLDKVIGNTTYSASKIFYLNGMWFAFWHGSNSTNNSVFYRSVDAINWTNIDSVKGTISSINYADGLYMLSVKKSSADSKTKDYYYSKDGVSWTSGVIFEGNTTQVVTFYEAGGLWFASYYGSTSRVSTDGVNWLSITLPVEDQIESVAHGNGIYVGVLKNNDRVVYSTDGVSWIASDLECSGKVKYVNNVFFLRGTSETYQSEDGKSWEVIDIEDESVASNINVERYENGVYVGSGRIGTTDWLNSHNTILYSV